MFLFVLSNHSILFSWWGVSEWKLLHFLLYLCHKFRDGTIFFLSHDTLYLGCVQWNLYPTGSVSFSFAISRIHRLLHHVLTQQHLFSFQAPKLPCNLS